VLTEVFALQIQVLFDNFSRHTVTTLGAESHVRTLEHLLVRICRSDRTASHSHGWEVIEIVADKRYLVKRDAVLCAVAG